MLMLEMLLKEATMRQLSVREGGVWLWLLLLVVGEHDDGGDGESGKCVTLYTREALTDPPPRNRINQQVAKTLIRGTQSVKYIAGIEGRVKSRV